MSFATWFRFKVFQHLLHAHTFAFFQVEQVFAMNFLNSAQLDIGTLANTKSDFVNWEKHFRSRSAATQSSEVVDYGKFIFVCAASQELDNLRNQMHHNPNTGKFKVSKHF